MTALPGNCDQRGLGGCTDTDHHGEALRHVGHIGDTARQRGHMLTLPRSPPSWLAMNTAGTVTRISSACSRQAHAVAQEPASFTSARFGQILRYNVAKAMVLGRARWRGARVSGVPVSGGEIAMVYRLGAIPVLRSGASPRGCRAPQLFAGGLLPAGRRLAAGAVLAALVLLAASVPASAQALTWSVVPSPSPGSGSGLAGVSCVSAAACTAVGRDTSSSGATQTLIESWNGTRWSIAPYSQPGSSSVLYGVSCLPGSTCTAVGFYRRTLPALPGPSSSPGTALRGRWCPAQARGLTTPSLACRAYQRRRAPPSASTAPAASAKPSPNRGTAPAGPRCPAPAQDLDITHSPACSACPRPPAPPWAAPPTPAPATLRLSSNPGTAPSGR